MLLAAGVGGLELSGRLAGVISSWVGDLFGSLGSGGGCLHHFSLIWVSFFPIFLCCITSHKVRINERINDA